MLQLLRLANQHLRYIEMWNSAKDSGVQDLAFTLGVWNEGKAAMPTFASHLHIHIFPGLGALFGRRKEGSSFATILLKCHGITRKDIQLGSITHDA